MFSTLKELDRNEPTMLAAIAVALIGAAALVIAWYFQYVIGLPPCPLCLEQRVAYYFAVPLAALVMLGVPYGASRKVLMLALLAIAAGMLWNAGLGVYHSGVEWGWWPGPQECSGVPKFGTIDDLLDRAQRATVIRCDVAAWRDPILGLSLAGYNVLISLGLAVVALRGALATRLKAYGSSSVSQ
jgi:disulfide bond formation protein DsbB